MKSKSSKILTGVIAAILIFTFIATPITAQARSIFEWASGYRNFPNELYLVQQESDSCTVAASAMMMRARFYMSGSSKWRSITESAVRPSAMLEGVGIRWEWTYTNGSDSATAGHENVSGITLQQVKNLLRAHPEGIILYTWSPHAVFVTDIVGSTIYCADPAAYVGGKRIPIEDSWLGSCHGDQATILDSVIAYWYVKSYSIGGSPISYSESDIISDPVLNNNSSLSASSIKLGSTININGSASGGTGGYKYAYYFKKSSASTWTTKKIIRLPHRCRLNPLQRLHIT